MNLAEVEPFHSGKIYSRVPLKPVLTEADPRGNTTVIFNSTLNCDIDHPQQSCAQRQSPSSCCLTVQILFKNANEAFYTDVADVRYRFPVRSCLWQWRNAKQMPHIKCNIQSDATRDAQHRQTKHSIALPSIVHTPHIWINILKHSYIDIGLTSFLLYTSLQVNRLDLIYFTYTL